jgi:hypothetical protein
VLSAGPLSLFVLLLVFTLLLGVAALGQTAGTGAIAGIVSDPSGAVISQASVRVTNNQTGEKRTVESAASGNYSVSLLQPGTYTVEASKAGFKNTSYRAITVSVTENPDLEHSASSGQRAGNRPGNGRGGTVADGDERLGPRDR